MISPTNRAQRRRSSSPRASATTTSPSSPQAVGAGIVSITISNQSKEPASLVLEGPTDEASEEIAPNNVATIKITLDEGDYIATAGEGNEQREDVLRVGAERASSSNELLLP